MVKYKVKNPIKQIFIEKTITMGCGCKKKKDAIRAARTRTATNIVITEGEVKEVPRPPDVLKPPRPKSNVNQLVDKLNKILES